MTKVAPRRLTEAFVEALPLGQVCVVRDTRVTGFLVTVNKSTKSYKVQRDLRRGQRGQRTLIKTVRHTLGSTEDLSLEAARHKAEDVIRLIKRGIDPNAPIKEQGGDAWTVDMLFDEYAADLRAREKSERTIEDTLSRRDRYLRDWKRLPLTELTRSMVRDFRAAYNLALRVIDDPDLLPDNPVKAVTFNKERRKDAVIMPEDLAAWLEKIHRLPNPLRRLMHELGLFSGLRPGTLVGLKRSWIKQDQRAISIPTMKSGRSFDLPLSKHMLDVIERVLALSDMLYPKAVWLFPTRANTDDDKRSIAKGDVIATQVWREKSLPSETGHLLRHTYRTVAQRIGIDKIDARLLLDHTVPGIDGVYIHERALFDRLLDGQERMSAALLSLTRPRLSAKETSVAQS